MSDFYMLILTLWGFCLTKKEQKKGETDFFIVMCFSQHCNNKGF